MDITLNLIIIMKTFKQITTGAIFMATNALLFAQDSLKVVNDTVNTTTTNVVEHTTEHNNWWWLLLLLLPLLYFILRRKPAVKDTYINRDTKDDGNKTKK